MNGYEFNSANLWNINIYSTRRQPSWIDNNVNLSTNENISMNEWKTFIICFIQHEEI